MYARARPSPEAPVVALSLEFVVSVTFDEADALFMFLHYAKSRSRGHNQL